MSSLCDVFFLIWMRARQPTSQRVCALCAADQRRGCENKQEKRWRNGSTAFLSLAGVRGEVSTRCAFSKTTSQNPTICWSYGAAVKRRRSFFERAFKSWRNAKEILYTHTSGVEIWMLCEVEKVIKLYCALRKPSFDRLVKLLWGEREARATGWKISNWLFSPFDAFS